MRVLVIADDFTGAAEIAAAGVRFGLTARVGADGGDGVTAIDTNSRLLSADAAVRAIELTLADVDLSQFDLIFKKTDSVLRGPVAAEVEAVAKLAGLRGAILCPQNPSKGRTIIDGVYRIAGVPIAQTQFARDPNYPATSSKVMDLLNRDGRVCKQICQQRLIIGEGDDADRLRHWATEAGNEFLPAGGVEYFEAVLRTRNLSPKPVETPTLTGRTLMVLGSACDSSRAFLRTIDPSLVCTLPNCDLAAKLDEHGHAVLAFPEVVDTGLQSLLIEAAALCPIDTLLIEGGTTAAAIFSRMGWQAFDLRGELAPGVVVLQPLGGGPTVVVKPGSYPWPPRIMEGACSVASG